MLSRKPMRKVVAIVQSLILVLIFSLFLPTVTLKPLSVKPSEAIADTTVKTIASGTKYATSLYVIKSGVPGPVVMVTGGVHGNEPAGYQAARLIKNYSVKKGTLLVIPEANRLAVLNKTRTATGVGDLNRSFPTSSTDKPDDPLAQAIWKTVKDYNVDWLIDLHEGYEFHLQDSSSWGQTVIYYPNSGTKAVADRMVSALNSSISTSSKKFSTVKYPLPGTLARSTGQYLGVHSFIIESCRLESINTRIGRHTTAVEAALKYLGMM